MLFAQDPTGTPPVKDGKLDIYALIAKFTPTEYEEELQGVIRRVILTDKDGKTLHVSHCWDSNDGSYTSIEGATVAKTAYGDEADVLDEWLPTEPSIHECRSTLEATANALSDLLSAQDFPKGDALDALEDARVLLAALHHEDAYEARNAFRLRVGNLCPSCSTIGCEPWEVQHHPCR